MDTRVGLLNAVEDLAAGAARGNIVIDVSEAALRLSSEFAQSGLTIDEICERIESAAVAAGAIIRTNSEAQSAA